MDTKEINIKGVDNRSKNQIFGNYHRPIIIRVNRAPIHEGIVRELAKRWKIPLVRFKKNNVVDVTRKNFSCGEILAHVNGSVRGAVCYIISQPSMSETRLYRDCEETRQVITSCSLGSAAHIQLFMPFIPQTRQDKKAGKRDFATFKPFIRSFENACVNKNTSFDITTFHLHADQLASFTLGKDMEHILMDKFWANKIASRFGDKVDPSQMAILAPDFGAGKFTKKVAKRLGLPVVILDKDRLHMEQEVSGSGLLVGEPRPIMIEVDDMLDTAGTATLGASRVIAVYPEIKELHFMGTHFVGSGKAYERLLNNPAISSWTFTNSCKIPKKFRDLQNFTIEDISYDSARFIDNIQNDKSNTNIFF